MKHRQRSHTTRFGAAVAPFACASAGHDPADLSDAAAVRRLVERAAERFGAGDRENVPDQGPAGDTVHRVENESE